MLRSAGPFSTIPPYKNKIHNGRHARLIADLLILRLGGERLSWGAANLLEAGEVRTCYIAAIQAADDYDMGLLLAFARA